MDFRLKVFYTVANRLSFTKAATELFITQPAISKHIQELEEQYKIKLFDRNGSKISLTNAGEVLLKHTNNIFEIYREIDFDMSSLINEHTGLLRIGASTTISQYILIKKMEVAKRMLLYSDYSCADIANFLSYTSQSYFIQVFKKQVGMTPLAYRNSFFRKQFVT